MYSTIPFTLTLILWSTFAQASMISPTAGQSWSVGSSETVSWDTSGLTAPLEIELVPGGATDLSVIVETIASKFRQKARSSFTKSFG